MLFPEAIHKYEVLRTYTVFTILASADLKTVLLVHHLVHHLPVDLYASSARWMLVSKGMMIGGLGAWFLRPGGPGGLEASNRWEHNLLNSHKN